MRIGIDIDGVCNNLVEEWIRYLNLKYSLDVKYTDIEEYYMRKYFPSLTEAEFYEPLFLDELWTQLIPTENSAKYLKKLIDDGHEVKLITATDVANMQVKVNWVLIHYPFFNKNNIWLVHDKQWINSDILLDDCIDNLLNGNYTGVCYSQPWNQEYSGLRVNSWKEFYNLIKSMNK